MAKFTAECARCNIEKEISWNEDTPGTYHWGKLREAVRQSGWCCAGVNALTLCGNCHGIISRAYKGKK